MAAPLAAVAVLLLSSGCAALVPGGNSAVAVSAGVRLTPDEVRGAGDVTIRMIDSNTSTSGVGRALERNIAAFQAQYPNITIDRSTKAFSDYGKTVALELAGEDAPDIALADGAIAPRLVAGNLTRPLDDYYEAYGWATKYPSSIRTQLRADASGKTSPSGRYWGLALGGEMVGVFSNDQLLAELGLPAPRTLDEFERALATARDAGVVPIQLGNLEQYPATAILSSLMNVYDDPHRVSDWVYGAKGTTFDTPGTRSALAKLREWVEAGYIPDAANGMRDDDVAVAFAGGAGLFTITGTWRQAQFAEGLGDRGGFMLLPPLAESGAASATGAVADAFTISTRSAHPDIAAFFLDFMFGPACASSNLDGGYLPFSQEPVAAAPGIAGDVLDRWSDVIAADTLVPYLGFAAPAMGDTLWPITQSFLGGRSTSDEVIEAVQAAWSDYHAGS